MQLSKINTNLISVRLPAAFVGACAVVVVMTVISIFALVTTGGTLSDVSRKTVPAVVEAGDLTQSARVVAAETKRFVYVTDESDREVQINSLLEEIGSIRNNLHSLESSIQSSVFGTVQTAVDDVSGAVDSVNGAKS